MTRHRSLYNFASDLALAIYYKLAPIRIKIDNDDPSKVDRTYDGITRAVVDTVRENTEEFYVSQFHPKPPIGYTSPMKDEIGKMTKRQMLTMSVDALLNNPKYNGFYSFTETEDFNGFTYRFSMYVF